MRHRHCGDRNCPDCYPERWQRADDAPHAFSWPVNAILLGLLVILAVVYVSAAPGP